MYKLQRGFTSIQIAFSIFAGVVIIGGVIGGILYFSRPELESRIGKCGDGICDIKEKANLNLCPKDCKAPTRTTTQSPTQPTTPTIIPSISNFISGFKIQNLKNTKELSEVTFKLAQELGLDYILVPVGYPKEEVTDMQKIDWSTGLDYYYIFELANKYDISVLPAFYKLGGKEDTNYEKYASFVILFLDEFYEKKKIDYIEFQNEPVAEYNGKTSRHFGGTPTDLAKSNTAAYNKVKEKYPPIKIGTAGFLATHDGGISNSSNENKIMNNYYKEYFSAKPKFDFLTLHQYPKTSSYLQEVENSATKYNFTSEYKIFETYRNFLNDYGYSDKPILVTEGVVHMPFKESSGRPNWNWLNDEEISILLMERFILTLDNSKNKNIIGSMVSDIEGSDKTALFDYNETTGDYAKTSKFYFYKKLLEFIREYPIHSKHIAGEVDSEHYWIEEFKNSEGGKMWMAFCPFLFWTEAESPEKPATIAAKKSIICPQQVTFDVGNITSVKISTISGSSIVNVVDGKVNFNLEKKPVFIEEK